MDCSFFPSYFPQELTQTSFRITPSSSPCSLGRIRTILPPFSMLLPTGVRNRPWRSFSALGPVRGLRTRLGEQPSTGAKTTTTRAVKSSWRLRINPSVFFSSLETGWLMCYMMNGKERGGVIQGSTIRKLPTLKSPRIWNQFWGLRSKNSWAFECQQTFFNIPLIGDVSVCFFLPHPSHLGFRDSCAWFSFCSRTAIG